MRKVYKYDRFEFDEDSIIQFSILIMRNLALQESRSIAGRPCLYTI